jgi:hypothetical protein
VNISYYKNSEGELVPEYKLKEIFTDEKFSWKSLVSDLGHRMMIMGVVRPGSQSASVAPTPLKEHSTFELQTSVSISTCDTKKEVQITPPIDHSMEVGSRCALVLAMMGVLTEESDEFDT